MSDLAEVVRTPNLVIPIADLRLDDLIKRRREMVRRPADYSFLGKMYRLFFIPDAMNAPNPEDLDHPVCFRNELNWENDDPREAPTLAISRNDKSLLIIGPVPQLAPVAHPTPQWPDDYEKTDLPGWQVARGGRWENGKIVGRIPAGYMPKRYHQRYSDLTREYTPPDGERPNFANPDCFLVIRPVAQIYTKLTGVAQSGLIEPIVAGNGSQMAFLINPRTREGHLIGGEIRLSVELHTLPNGAKP